MQRLEPVAAVGRALGIPHQAVARFGRQRWPGWQPCEVQLTLGRCGVVSMLRRLLPCSANWRYRPGAGI